MMKRIEDVSRRGFLGIAAVFAALGSPVRRLLGGASAAAADRTGAGSTGQRTQQQSMEPDRHASYQYSLTGGWSPAGFLVTAQLDRTKDVNIPLQLAVSTESDMSNPKMFGPVRVDQAGLAHFVATGLTEPMHMYTCQLRDARDGTWFGDRFNGWTGPADAEQDYSFDIVLGSCLGNAGAVDAYGSEAALADAASLQVPLTLHLGDWGYWGQRIPGAPKGSYLDDLDRYTSAMAKFPELRKLVQQSNIETCISDHELHANGDKWQPHSKPDAFGCEHSIRQMTANRTLFPVATWGDPTTPAVHRGYYIDLAPHVRMVVSDFRSPQRNESADRDTDHKQMWGSTQEQWLYESAFAVDDDVVILFVNETSWWHRAPGDTCNDKPASYPNAQQRFMERLTGTGRYAHYPKIIDRFVWLGGDRHYCGFFDSADARNRDGFAQFIGSGFCKNSLLMHPQEYMTWQTDTRSDPDAWFPVVGYMKLTLGYDASAKTVTLTGNARAVASTHRQVTGAMLRKGSPIVTLGEGSFQASDKHQIITGRNIPDHGSVSHGHGKTATTIAEVLDDKRARLTANAKADASDVTLAILSDPADWVVGDYHPGGATVRFKI